MRIRDQEAEIKALALAESFLSSNDLKGWDWKCVEANPDLRSDDNKDRKTYIKWSVIVEYSKGGNFLDGPGVVLVNIQSKECGFL